MTTTTTMQQQQQESPPTFVGDIQITGVTKETRIFIKKTNSVQDNMRLLRAMIGCSVISIEYALHCLERNVPFYWKAKEDKSITVHINTLKKDLLEWRKDLCGHDYHTNKINVSRAAPNIGDSRKKGNNKPTTFFVPVVSVEKAKSSRSTCKTCGLNIPINSHRVGLRVFLGGHMTTLWQHPPCFFGLLVVDLAQNNRSRCKMDGTNLLKGWPRIVVRGYTTTNKHPSEKREHRVYLHPKNAGLILRNIVSLLSTSSTTTMEMLAGLNDLDKTLAGQVVAELQDAGVDTCCTTIEEAQEAEGLDKWENHA